MEKANDRRRNAKHLHPSIRADLKIAWVIFISALLGWMLFWAVANACDGAYAKIGIGYDISLSDDWVGDVPARFEFGYAWPHDGGWQPSLALVHDSNWDKGFPANDDDETSREAIMFELTYWGEQL